MSTVARRQAVKRIVVWPLIAVSFACASRQVASHQAASREPCALRADDAVFAATGDVFRECAVDRPARLSTKSIKPEWRPTPGRDECVSVDMEFVVDTTGKPETITARAVKATDREFADAY